MKVGNFKKTVKSKAANKIIQVLKEKGLKILAIAGLKAIKEVCDILIDSLEGKQEEEQEETQTATA